MDLGLSGKTAVVAGGSRGCGRGISEVLAAEGAAVVFSGHQRGPVTATETALLAAGGKTVRVVADMTTREGALAMKVPHLEDPMSAVNIRVAVNAVMKTLAQEYGPFGIAANVIATGPFDSELSRDYRASDPGVKTEKWYRAMLPAGRWGNPVEMGWLAAFLCSERAAFLTGETIRLDGGYGKSLF